MKAAYFTQEQADDDDFYLLLAKDQGYVPQKCLLGGELVMILINTSKDPCHGCNCDRSKCGGREA